MLVSGGSIMAFGLAAILAMALFMACFIFYVECLVIDELENRCKKFKNDILISNRRKKFMHKAAVSFGTVTVNTTYPFCNVNRSKFLEWTDAGINNIVNLLLM